MGHSEESSSYHSENNNSIASTSKVLDSRSRHPQKSSSKPASPRSRHESAEEAALRRPGGSQAERHGTSGKILSGRREDSGEHEEGAISGGDDNDDEEGEILAPPERPSSRTILTAPTSASASSSAPSDRRDDRLRRPRSPPERRASGPRWEEHGRSGDRDDRGRSDRLRREYARGGPRDWRDRDDVPYRSTNASAGPSRPRRMERDAEDTPSSRSSRRRSRSISPPPPGRRDVARRPASPPYSQRVIKDARMPDRSHRRSRSPLSRPPAGRSHYRDEGDRAYRYAEDDDERPRRRRSPDRDASERSSRISRYDYREWERDGRFRREDPVHRGRSASRTRVPEARRRRSSERGSLGVDRPGDTAYSLRDSTLRAPQSSDEASRSDHSGRGTPLLLARSRPDASTDSQRSRLPSIEGARHSASATPGRGPTTSHSHTNGHGANERQVPLQTQPSDGKLIPRKTNETASALVSRTDGLAKDASQSGWKVVDRSSRDDSSDVPSAHKGPHLLSNGVGGSHLRTSAAAIPLGPKSLQYRRPEASSSSPLRDQDAPPATSSRPLTPLQSNHDHPPPPPTEQPPPPEEEAAPPPPPSPSLHLQVPLSFSHTLLPTELPQEEREKGYQVTYDPALGQTKGKGKEVVKRYASLAEGPSNRPVADPRRSSTAVSRLQTSKRKKRTELWRPTWTWDQNSTEPKPPPPPRGLVVTGLSPLTTLAQLRAHFRTFGRIQESEIKVNPQTGQSLGIFRVLFAHDFDEDEEGKLLDDAPQPGQRGDLSAATAVTSTDGQRLGTSDIMRVELDNLRGDKYVKAYREELGRLYKPKTVPAVSASAASDTRAGPAASGLSRISASGHTAVPHQRDLPGAPTGANGESQTGPSALGASQVGRTSSPSSTSTTQVGDVARRADRERNVSRTHDAGLDDGADPNDSDEYGRRRVLAQQHRMAVRANGRIGTRTSVDGRQGLDRIVDDRSHSGRARQVSMDHFDAHSEVMERIAALQNPYVFIARSKANSALSTSDLRKHLGAFLPQGVHCDGDGWYATFTSRDAASRCQMVLGKKPLLGYNIDIEVHPAPRLSAEDLHAMKSSERRARLSSTAENAHALQESDPKARTSRSAHIIDPDLTGVDAARQLAWHKQRSLAEERVTKGWTEDEVVEQARSAILRELADVFIRDLKNRVIGPHLSDFLKPEAAGGQAIKRAAQARSASSRADSVRVVVANDDASNAREDATDGPTDQRLPSFRKKWSASVKSSRTSDAVASKQSVLNGKRDGASRTAKSHRSRVIDDDEDDDDDDGDDDSSVLVARDTGRTPMGRRDSITSQRRSSHGASNRPRTADKDAGRVDYSSSSDSDRAPREGDQHMSADEDDGAASTVVSQGTKVEADAGEVDVVSAAAPAAESKKGATRDRATLTKKGSKKGQAAKKAVVIQAPSPSEQSATPEAPDLAVLEEKSRANVPLSKAQLASNEDSELSKLKSSAKKAKAGRARSPTPDPVALGIVQEEEDLYYLKLALERLQAGESVAPSHVPDIDLDDQREEADGEAPDGEAQMEDEDMVRIPKVVHQSGSARTEGFYKIPPAQKAAHLPDRNKAIADSTTNHVALASARDNRADSRRLVLGIEQHRKETASDTDILKFNQLRSRKKQLKFAKSPIHDWGLYAMELIPAGDMVIEYVGEVIRQQVADHRERQYEKQGNFSTYLFRVDDDLVVDATHKGNIARLMNHCCVPNCNAKILTLNGQKRIVLYAKTTILPGQELTYDYKFQATGNEEDAIACLCGAEGCRRFL
ncbi:unnamed protein product [Parajaminaea phylloscopi]